MSSKIEPLEIDDSKTGDGSVKKKGLFLSFKMVSLVAVGFSLLLVACILATYFGKPTNDQVEIDGSVTGGLCQTLYCKNQTLLECNRIFIFI
jgi:hypothetical protein